VIDPKADWRHVPLVLVDTETTGVDPQTARIWEFGLFPCAHLRRPLAFVPGAVLVDPEQEIPEAVVNLCRLDEATLGMILHARPMSDVGALVRDRLDGTVVVGYNVLGYDWPLIKAEYERANLAPPTPGAIIDVMVLFKELCLGRKAGLSDALAWFALSLPGGAAMHRTKADCTGTLLLLEALEPELPTTLEDLIVFQAYAQARQRADFERYSYWLRSGPNGRLVLACGKWAGTPLGLADPGYLRWVLDKSRSWDNPPPEATLEAFRQRLAPPVAAAP